MRQTSSGTKESDKRIVQGADLPSIHTSSQQGRECLMHNMCCSGTVIKKTVYRWKTNSKMIPDARASIYISPNLDNRHNDVLEDRDIIEMEEVPESAVLIRHPNQKSNEDVNMSKGSTSTLKKKKVTLRFAQDLVNDQFSKSEGDANFRNNNSFSLLIGSKNNEDPKIVSEGNSCYDNNAGCLKKEKFKFRSQTYENVVPEL